MRTRLLCTTAALAAVLVFTAPAGSGQANDAAPNARVDAVFANYDKPDSPGCALGVYRDGVIVYARGYGMADLERRVPISPAPSSTSAPRPSSSRPPPSSSCSRRR